MVSAIAAATAVGYAVVTFVRTKLCSEKFVLAQV